MGYSVSQVERLTGINRKTLHFWDHSGFLSPSLRAAHGTGSRRLYSFRDLVALKVAAELREAGVSLQSLRLVTDRLRAMADADNPLAETYLVTDGRDVWERRGDELLSWLRQPGQRAFAFVIDVSRTVGALRASTDGAPVDPGFHIASAPNDAHAQFGR
jgi:DNA-binding transcriptional MerR regulator